MGKGYYALHPPYTVQIKLFFIHSSLVSADLRSHAHRHSHVAAAHPYDHGYYHRRICCYCHRCLSRRPKTNSPETKEFEKINVDEQLRMKRLRSTGCENDQLTGKSNKSEFEISGPVVAQVDRISELPEPIVHHILSLLPTPGDVARMSILSKKWRDIWISFGVLNFDRDGFFRWFRKGEDIKTMNELFVDFVDRSLQRLVSQNRNLKKMTLCLPLINSGLISHLDRWINIAIENNIIELDLNSNVRGIGIHPYRLPLVIFCSKSINSLRLCGFELEMCKDMEFSALQKLSMERINIDEWMIQSLISTCPQIVELKLVECRGFDSFQVSNLPKLERVDLHMSIGLTSIDLQAPSLLSFCYYGHREKFCNINLAASKSLEVLILENVKSEEFFRDQFNSFLSLEKLVLDSCAPLNDINISSTRLKELVLRRCKNLTNACIDTPNLLTFEYEGFKTPLLTMDPSNLKEVKLEFNIQRHNKRLQNFLKRFTDVNGLKLVISSRENVFIHEEPTEILLPPVDNVKLEIVKPSTSFEDLLEVLLQTSRPKTMSTCNIKLVEVICEKLLHREKSLSCCTYNSTNKCWRHYLEHVAVDNRLLTSYAVEDDWMRKWNLWIDSWGVSPIETVLFKLKWKESRRAQVKRLVFS